MTIGDPRYGSADPSAYAIRRRPEELPTPRMTRQGRRLGGADPAAVALALSGMTMYWLMPAMVSRGRPRRRPRSTGATSQGSPQNQ